MRERIDVAFSAKRLTEALRRKGMSARAAARELKQIRPDVAITHAYISQLASGKSTNPTTEVAEALAQLLDVSVDWLLDRKPPAQLSVEDQQLEAMIREDASELDIEFIAERWHGTSSMTRVAVSKMFKAMLEVERRDRGEEGPASASSDGP
jgi:transcriptional regulator with XRE-family HTH domain